MDHRISPLGFAFGNFSDDSYKFQYICINKKNSYVWGIGTDDNSVESIKGILTECVGKNTEVQYIESYIETTAVNMHSMRVNDFYTVTGNIVIICIRGEK